MTNFEQIKGLDFDNMVSLLMWGMCFSPNLAVPGCEDGCDDFGSGCANNCPHEKKQRAVREWLEKECD